MSVLSLFVQLISMIRMYKSRHKSTTPIPSSGVLAGMWPCGILIMLKELFTAESKAQVYAALHDLLSSHPNVYASLRMSKL